MASISEAIDTMQAASPPAPPATLTITAVISLYQKVLDRNPTETELISSVKLLQTGDTSLLDIEKTLMHGTEYRNAVLMQRNAVQSELEGIVTDQQIKMHIASRYHEMTGDEIDRATLEFLHDRYRNGYQDSGLLESLIARISIVPLDGTTVSTAAAASSAASPVNTG